VKIPSSIPIKLTVVGDVCIAVETTTKAAFYPTLAKRNRPKVDVVTIVPPVSMTETTDVTTDDRENDVTTAQPAPAVEMSIQATLPLAHSW
jgi:short-subunit dehydrogenase involved in D-alanine esterification of teichoic acids